MNGIGAQEICVTTALGLCDFISAMDSDRVQEWNCWYHILNVRSFPKLHTNPVFVRVDGRPIRGSKESARWCVGVIGRLWTVREPDIAAAERPEAERAFRKAMAIYSRIAAESD